MGGCEIKRERKRERRDAAPYVLFNGKDRWRSQLHFDLVRDRIERTDSLARDITRTTSDNIAGNDKTTFFKTNFHLG